LLFPPAEPPRSENAPRPQRLWDRFPTTVAPWRWLVALGALFLLARFRTAFIEVLDTDETIFHTVASRVLAGERLYLDVCDIKPPGIFFFYMLVQALFGDGLLPVHHVFSVVVMATAWAVGAMARRLADDSRAGFFGAAIYLAFHGVGDAASGSSSSTEQLAALPISVAILLLLGGPSPARALSGGAFVGLAILFKPQAGAVGIAMALAILVHARRRWCALTSLAAGAGLPLLAAWGGFAAVGLGEAFWRWGVLEGLAYASRAEVSYLREVSNLLAYLGLHVLPIALAVWALRRFLHGQDRLLVAGWLACAVLASAAGGRVYWNNFVLISVPLAVAAGVAAPAWWARLRPAVRVLVAMVALSPSLASQAWLFWQEHRGHGSLRSGHEALGRQALFYLEPGGRLLAFGSAAPIYYVTRTSPPTPFLVTDHLFHYLDPNLLEHPDDILRHADPDRLRAFVAALRRPDVQVVIDAPYSAWEGYSLERVPEVAQVVRQDFAPAHRAFGGTVWVRARRARGGPGI
jgi:hypothetical protein